MKRPADITTGGTPPLQRRPRSVLRIAANVLLNSFRWPYGLAMARKLRKRYLERPSWQEREEAIRWCRERAEDLRQFAEPLNSALWQESEAFAIALRRRAEGVLSSLPVPLGGGGHFQLLYFLTRLMQPEVIVETGVGAGYSTQAFLSAIHRNGKGRLYSSDFPYLQFRNPEQYIGTLVTSDLKKNWDLYVEGDRRNLNKIAARVTRIDILHYDSDKSFSGRAFALGFLEPLLSPRSVIVMDDIQGNAFFHRYVEQRQVACRVFACPKKYVGLIGL